MRHLALALSVAIAPVVFARTTPTYRVTHTYMLGGDGSWDYIVPDPPAHRVFIGRQDRVMVVDENDGKLPGEVTGINGAQGTAIDPGDGTLVTNIALGGKPEYRAAAGDGKVYANLTDTGEVVEIDARAATVARRWPTGTCKQPVSMAIDTARHRLFSGCRSGVMAISDYQAAKVVAPVPIGTGVNGAGYDAAAGDAFASNADGTLTVIHQDGPGQYRVVDTLQTPQGAQNMGLDPVSHRLFSTPIADGTLLASPVSCPPASAPRRAMFAVDWAALVMNDAAASAVQAPDDLQPLHAAAVEHSDAYRTRAKIHKIASIATLPLFAAEVALGQSLYNSTNGGQTQGSKSAHIAVGASIMGLFAVNTATGAWNLFGEDRQEHSGRALRLVHGLLMMAADAGFVATAATGPHGGRDGLVFAGTSASTHRAIAFSSIGVGTVGYLVMLIGSH